MDSDSDPNSAPGVLEEEVTQFLGRSSYQSMTGGRKEVLALMPGYRESAESWGEVLRDLRDLGLKAPLLLAADGNLGIWAAASEVWPTLAEQRCWNHKILNVLAKLPKRLRILARQMLTRIPYAPTREEARKLRDQFSRRFEADYPQAVETLHRDWDRMVAFYDFPEAHWKHLRTTNVVESPFSSVRLRTDAARRFKKATKATAMIWRVLIVAEQHSRRLGAPHLLAAVYAGQKYQDGKPIDPRKVMAA